MSQVARTDSVIIVGAGPTGLTAAWFLVKAGIPVTLLEQAHGLCRDMRASTFHPATLDLLAAGGITAKLLEQGTRVPRWQYLRQADGQRVVFDLGMLDGLTAHPYRLQCEQFRLCSALMGELRDNRLFRMRRGTRLIRCQQDEEFVDLGYETAGAPAHERCRWLIAADGAGSTVRKSLGLEFAGDVFPRTSITLVVDYPFEQQVDGLLGVNYLWTEHGHCSLMQVRDRWRFSYSPEPGQALEEALAPETLQARLQAVFPAAQPYRVEQCNHYTLQQRCLQSFRQARVLFAGDAAHLNSPAGGMGMNSGIHDAACLVEHLLPVLAGETPELLDRYDRRRRTIAVEEVQRLSARNYRWHRETDPVRREQVWAQLQATAADPQLAREFLLDSSMLNSLQREKAIP
jgi:3-(3-hydroxy-phenyl)propionate hydroxylase